MPKENILFTISELRFTFIIVEEPANTFTLKAERIIGRCEENIEEPKPKILTQEEWIDLKNEIENLINNTAIHLPPKIVAYSVVIIKYNNNNRNPVGEYELKHSSQEAIHLMDKLNTVIRKGNDGLCKIQ
ncbi:hypothetical protein ABK040_014009 [Willaertia magna]